MKQYLDLLQHVLDNGVEKEDRTGTGTISVFGYQMRFHLDDGFPLLTTKKLHLRSIIYELLWFLWAGPDGELGPIYGHQWRSWGCADGRHVDQISNLINEIKSNPDSRRLLVSAWNVGELEQMHLPPCHILFQFYVSEGRLSCQLYQRSADIFLGVPFNIASYALFTMMIAQTCGLKYGDFVHTLGDAHIYKNHIEQCRLQLTRNPRPLPTMRINPEKRDIFGFDYEDFVLEGYDPHPHIKGEVSV